MPAKLTADKLIDKFIKIHGKRYDYSKVVYVNQWQRVIIKCRQHGEFTQTPNQHSRGANCPSCSIITASRSRTGEFDRWVAKCNVVHNFKYSYNHSGKFKSTRMVDICCPEHGRFLQVAYDHVRGAGCPMCSDSGFNRLALGYLYVLISDDLRFFKVGITGNIPKRLRRLSYNTPFYFHLISSYQSTGKNVEEIERSIHARFKSAGMEGFDGATEWLKTDNQIEEVLHELSESKRIKPVDEVSRVVQCPKHISSDH